MPRSKQTLSNYKLLTGDMGLLYPVGLTEVLPNDTFQHQTDVFMRLSPMAAPVMHPVTARVHHFFVPHRLTWPTEKQAGQPATGWEAFITSGADGNDAQTIPQLSSSIAKGSLQDYLGLPVTTDAISYSALPIRCYNLIFREWFRDQDLVPEDDDLDKTDIKNIAWEKDYYTTARPWPQKGSAVTLPLGSSAPVRGIGKENQSWAGPQSVYETGGTGTTDYAASQPFDGQAPGNTFHAEEDPLNPGFPGIYADLAAAQGVDIVTWRTAFALQRFAEARARYGSRYTEYLKYLGANPQDFRLQRPELLASGKSKVRISEVLQTANETTPGRFGVGDLYGHGYATTGSNAYRRHFNEHGYIMTLLSVRPKAMYMNGMDRTWMRRTREEFWQKELQHIGQEEVFNGEVLANGSGDHDTFGYSDRYQSYRYQRSSVAGDFRDNLKYWHMARDFGTTRPALNEQFINCDATKRIFNVQSEDTLWIAAQHRMVARRLIARNATPRVL